MTTLTFPPDAPAEVEAPAAAPQLRWRKRGQPAQSIDLGSGKWTIGSSPRCNVCLPDAEVRPLQCLLTLEGDVATVTRWAAGVLLNGQEFRSAPLRNGDRFSVAGWEIEVQGVRTLIGPDALSPQALPPLERPVLPRGAETAPSDHAWESAQESSAAEPTGSPAALTTAPVAADAIPAPSTPRPCFDSQAFGDSLIVELWRSHDAARGRCRALVKSLRTTRSECVRLATSLAAAQHDLEAAQADLETVRAAQRVSAAALAAARLTVPVKSSDTRPLEAIQNVRLKAAEDRAAALAAEVAELASRRRSLEEELAAQTDESARLADRLAGAAAEQERLAAQVGAGVEARAELEAELADRGRRLEERERSFAEQLAAANREKEQLAALIATDRESRSRLEAELAGRSESLDRHEEQHAAQLAEATQLRRQLEAQIAAEQESRSLLEAELVDRGRSVDERDRRIAEIEAELADHARRQAEYEGQLAERDGHLTEVQADLAEVRAQLSETQAANARLAEEATSAARLHWAAASAATDDSAHDDEEARVSHQPPSDPLSLSVGAAWPTFPGAATSFGETAADDLERQAKDRLPTWDFSCAAAWGVAHEESAAEPAAGTASVERGSSEEPVAPIAEETDDAARFPTAAPAEHEALRAAEEPPATPPGEITFEAPKENSSPSFIEQYRHLLEGRTDENCVASAPLLDEEFQSARKPKPVVEETQADADDALEDYMAQLMNRVRGGGSTGHDAPACKDAPGRQAARQSAEPAAPVAEPTDAPTLPEQPGVFDLAMLRRKTRQMPESVDFSAMRDLANQSAHGAISAHRQRRRAEVAYTRFALCVIASVAALVLMTGAPSFESPRYLAGLACGIGAFGAAFQWLRVARAQRTDRDERSQPTEAAVATELEVAAE